VEESPEFRKALAEACEAQYREFMYGGGIPKGKVGDSAEEIQRQRAEIEEKVAGARLHAERVRREAEIMSNPHAREITENLRKLHSVDSGIMCPKCGETNSHGNKNNGKPYCYKCQQTMISREKAEKWVKPSPPKGFSRGFTEPDGVARVRK
jgi:endogenous inhibitor of DNA gyrase (YacG/DUF329 family)